MEAGRCARDSATGGNPARDFPLLLNLWRTGRLPLERLITGRIGLEDVNIAFDDLVHGIGIRSVIVNE